jgi:ribokinase
VESWDVAVVGSLNMDLVVGTPRFPQPGETLLAGPFATASGGKGLNQALAAARQGARTRLVGSVGDDAHGAELRAVAVGDGIDGEGIVTRSGPSGVALITVAPDGQNTILVAPGANATTDAAQVAADPAVRAARVVLAQLEVPLDVVHDALALARRAGHRTILNPAPAVALSDEVLACCDLLVPNETEAALLTGVDTSDLAGAELAARALLARGVGAVVVTLGARGALYVDARDRIVMAPFAVEAIDATAAGDAFCGTLAAALADGLPMPAALRRASAAGALATTVRGASPSLPTRAAVDALINRQP